MNYKDISKLLTKAMTCYGTSTVLREGASLYLTEVNPICGSEVSCSGCKARRWRMKEDELALLLN
ncbi:hypothetical protein H5410_042605 [Solanum commersonii]|uniref:Uncharacterized protein n=1 Tax=Solanum commersonii TaxID=4109 RepID=A0A9J5XUT3_SOLCO|nr:hypothetical protein H5410_042605 [Solanum commersonii]